MSRATEPRLTNAEARVRLLEAGAEQFQRNPVRSGLDRIRVVDVVGALGLTSGAFYHQWDSIEAYRADLFDYLADPRRFPTVDLVLSDLIEGITEQTFEGAVESAARLAWDGLTGDPDRQRTFLALWLLDEERVLSALRGQYAFQTESWARVLELGLPLFDRRLRPPWTTTSLAVAVTALIEGYFLRWAIDQAATGGNRSDLGFVAAARTLLAGATERLP